MSDTLFFLSMSVLVGALFVICRPSVHLQMERTAWYMIYLWLIRFAYFLLMLAISLYGIIRTISVCWGL